MFGRGPRGSGGLPTHAHTHQRIHHETPGLANPHPFPEEGEGLLLAHGLPVGREEDVGPRAWIQSGRVPHPPPLGVGVSPPFTYFVTGWGWMESSDGRTGGLAADQRANEGVHVSSFERVLRLWQRWHLSIKTPWE